MSIEKNDPRLTALALGELPDNERKRVEEALEQNPELAAEVEAIRAVAASLQKALAEEPLPKASAPAAKNHRGGRFLRTLLYASAVLVIAALGVALLFPDQTGRMIGFYEAPETGDSEAPESANAEATPDDVESDGERSNFGGGSSPRRSDGRGKKHHAESAEEAPDDTADYAASGEDSELSSGQPAIDPMSLAAPLEESAPGGTMSASPADYAQSTASRAPAPEASATPAPPATPPAGPGSLSRLKDSSGPLLGIELGQSTGGLSRRRLAETQQEPGARPMTRADVGGEAYETIQETGFLSPLEAPFSTFSIDVDTAAYANMRRFINSGQLPPKDAVRIEEMINYFKYDYDGPEDTVPFAAHVEVSPCPWNPQHQLAKVGLKGKEIKRKQRPPLNLVFLLDVSGSMRSQNKLPLVKQGMIMLAETLGEKDHVAIVTYAGSSGLVLPPTRGDDDRAIMEALERLQSGGSTAGAAGIQQAYDVAQEHFNPEAVNRVILCTDGDFNVGITDRSKLIELIEEKAKSGVFLTVLGFGMGNLKDATLEQLADKGNGNYGYIDNLSEARKVLVDELSGTLVTIAKDVKIQIDFNPANVQAYRLIGYENRRLADRDFHDDTKDAGEIGAGHTVTALYEIIPPGVPMPNFSEVDASRYETPEEATSTEPAPTIDDALADELFLLKLRYKLPDENKSSLLEFPIKRPEAGVRPSKDLEFAASVALFGMLLRESRYVGDGSYDTVLELAESGKGRDAHGYRDEFIELVRAVSNKGR